MTTCRGLLRHQVLQGQIVGALTQRAVLVGLKAELGVGALALLSGVVATVMMMESLVHHPYRVGMFRAGGWPDRGHIAEEALTTILGLEASGCHLGLAGFGAHVGTTICLGSDRAAFSLQGVRLLDRVFLLALARASLLASRRTAFTGFVGVWFMVLILDGVQLGDRGLQAVLPSGV